MNCIDNVKDLYKSAEELKNNLLKEDQKINNLAIKNDIEINEIKEQFKNGLEKVNAITQILNQHTEILTEQSTNIAKIQAITYQNSEKIDEIYALLFNHAGRIKSLERRVDKIEEVLRRHEESILSLAGDVSDMKKTMNQVLEKKKRFGK